MPYPHVIRLRGPWQYTPLARFDEGPLPPPGRMELPTDWGATLGDGFRGRVRYERSFNPPTHLDPHERVWLVIEGADARADVSLNGHPLGTVDGYALASEWDITEGIGRRNVLSVEVELPDLDNDETAESRNSALRTPHSALDPPGRRHGSAPATGDLPLRTGQSDLPGGLIGQVRLEIRSTAFIDEFALWVSVEEGGPTMHCSGTVRGAGEAGSLSLVVGAQDREILYENVDVGKPFRFTAEAREMPAWTPGSAQRLAAAEIKLISGGEAVWRRQIETAAIAVESAGPDAITLADRAISPPHARAKLVSGDIETQVQKLIDKSAAQRAALVLPQILPEPLYARFDRAGVMVLQVMPLAWVERAASRLAHHPSIAAWLLPSGGSSSQPALPEPAFGRPWLNAPP